jgi:hypothetical protein
MMMMMMVMMTKFKENLIWFESLWDMFMIGQGHGFNKIFSD